jgi:hypothetical protein
MYDLAHKETDVCFEGALQTIGRISLLAPSNPPPCLKFYFCAFKVTLGLVRSYVTLAIPVYCPDSVQCSPHLHIQFIQDTF